jgi:hypothetical protein
VWACCHNQSSTSSLGCIRRSYATALRCSIRGSRRYQGKIFGKEESDEITVGRQARFHLKKQDVLLCLTSHADGHVTLLDHKTSRVIPIYRPLYPFDNKAVVANRKFTCRYAWNPVLLIQVGDTIRSGQSYYLRASGLSRVNECGERSVLSMARCRKPRHDLRYTRVHLR